MYFDNLPEMLPFSATCLATEESFQQLGLSPQTVMGLQIISTQRRTMK
jgi:hypothetical protein